MAKIYFFVEISNDLIKIIIYNPNLCYCVNPATGNVKLLQGVEEEAEEDVGGEEDEGEDDGAAHASPCRHAFAVFLLLGFLFP